MLNSQTRRFPARAVNDTEICGGAVPAGLQPLFPRDSDPQEMFLGPKEVFTTVNFYGQYFFLGPKIVTYLICRSIVTLGARIASAGLQRVDLGAHGGGVPSCTLEETVANMTAVGCAFVAHGTRECLC